MNEIKWIYRPFLAGLALVLWVITLWGTGEMPPEFLTGLVATAWATLFISREREKIANGKSVEVSK